MQMETISIGKRIFYKLSNWRVQMINCETDRKSRDKKKRKASGNVGASMLADKPLYYIIVNIILNDLFKLSWT